MSGWSGQRKLDLKEGAHVIRTVRGERGVKGEDLTQEGGDGEEEDSEAVKVIPQGLALGVQSVANCQGAGNDHIEEEDVEVEAEDPQKALGKGGGGHGDGDDELKGGLALTTAVNAG